MNALVHPPIQRPRNRLKRLQYRPHTLDGFIAGTGLTLNEVHGVSAHSLTE